MAEMDFPWVCGLKDSVLRLLKKTYEIDGENFSTLEEFYDEIERVLIPGVKWGRNLDAFNDILRGGFGTPEAGFVLRWKNSAKSKIRLGFVETIHQLEARLKHCRPANRSFVQQDLKLARSGTAQPSSTG